MTQLSESAVAVFLPHGREAELMGRLLRANDVRFVICRTAAELLDLIANGCGAVILAQHSLNDEGWERLLTQLEMQPAWSD